MSGAVSISSREIRYAEAVSESLVSQGLVSATCLLGSSARGDARADSDVDLLVVASKPTHAGALRAALPKDLDDPRLSLIARSKEGWMAAIERGSLFALHARLEGRVICDPDRWLDDAWARALDVPPDVAGELARQRRRLRALRQLDRFNGHFRFVLSDLFSIGKACAIAHCVDHGEYVFVKRRALEEVGAFRPELADAAHYVARLQPFYDAAHGRKVELPFSPNGDAVRVGQALDAVTTLARD